MTILRVFLESEDCEIKNGVVPSFWFPSATKTNSEKWQQIITSRINQVASALEANNFQGVIMSMAKGCPFLSVDYSFCKRTGFGDRPVPQQNLINPNSDHSNSFPEVRVEKSVKIPFL